MDKDLKKKNEFYCPHSNNNNQPLFFLVFFLGWGKSAELHVSLKNKKRVYYQRPRYLILKREQNVSKKKSPRANNNFSVQWESFYQKKKIKLLFFPYFADLSCFSFFFKTVKIDRIRHWILTNWKKKIVSTTTKKKKPHRKISKRILIDFFFFFRHFGEENHYIQISSMQQKSIGSDIGF